MSLKKTSKGYQIRWYEPDGRERKRTYKGIDRKEAERLEREILAQRDRGEPQHDLRRAPTFGAFADQWISEHRGIWKPSTQFQYGQVLKKHLWPRFGERRVNAINESLMRGLIGELKDLGLSPRRINLVVLVVKMIVKAARRDKWLRDDPLSEVSLLHCPMTDVDPLGPDEIDAYLAACPVWWQPYFTVAFWTGARPNELAALKWGEVDVTAGRFRIRTGRYRGVESPPKTPSSVRDIEMLPPVVEAFKAQKAQQAARRLKRGASGASDDYVFTGPDGGLLNLNHLRELVWYPTVIAAGLRRRVMYQTRHTFASNALAAGESPAWVSRALGHTTPEMLFKVYGRYIPNRTRRDGSALLIRLRGGSGLAEATSSTTEIRPDRDVAAGE